VIAVEFVPGGMSIATACADGNVRVRCTLAADVQEVVKHKITREFTHAELEQYAPLLGHDYDALLRAYQYVESGLASMPVEDLVAKLPDDVSLEADVRKAAASILEREYNEPTHLRQLTWEIVRQAGLPATEYEKAQRWASIVDDIEHQTPTSRVVLGVAQHRVGDEATALQTLNAVDPELAQASKGLQLSCMAALVLVQHALGDDDAARFQLARLDQLAGAPAEPVPFRYRVLLNEARALGL